jgi:hypothetical protein
MRGYEEKKGGGEDRLIAAARFYPALQGGGNKRATGTAATGEFADLMNREAHRAT